MSYANANMERPMSVEQVVKLASESFWDPHYSMTSWFRTADLMLKQADIYQHEGNLQMCYFLLYRHAMLMLEHLPKHPDAQDPKYRKAWVQARKALKMDLAKLESLKPPINQRYEQYLASRPSKGTSDLPAGQGRLAPDSQVASETSAQSRRRSSRQAVDPHQHKDLAVQVANLEVQRRLNRSSSAGVGDDQEDVNARLVDLRRQIDRASQAQSYDNVQNAGTAYSYPEVPPRTSSSAKVRGNSLTENSVYRSAPQRPPKELLPASKANLPPPRPSKDLIDTVQPRSESPVLSGVHQFASTATLESGAKLRTVFLPAKLRHRFLDIAEHNTHRHLETCGILAGTLIQNALFVTKLVIPEQTATSDTCEMLDELALFEWTDSQPEGLMVLGWIHTHPTQTCFLSSRDLHTHFPYQATLAESIAVVCAPTKKPDYGVFRMTDPPGLQAIKGCKQTNTFHPHDETHIYTDALGYPRGHVIEHDELNFEVVDLRPKK